MEAAIPLTVIGGYLGAGKTTLVNRLLRSPGGRRIGVIVNDFGSVSIDADLLAGSTTEGDVIGLANGCVCCTVGAGLHEALAVIAERRVDHVVIEVSGVADPAVAAAWATVPPFEPAGVIVLVAADQVMQLRRDRYVGAEVHRQIAGADLLLVTKSDRCDADRLAEVESWLADQTAAPAARVTDGDVAVDVVLGVRPAADRVSSPIGDEHDGRYVSWAWTSDEPVARDAVETVLGSLDPRVLRLKGWVSLDDGSTAVVQVVGRTLEVRTVDVRMADADLASLPPTGSHVVAIALAGTSDPFASGFR